MAWLRDPGQGGALEVRAQLRKWVPEYGDPVSGVLALPGAQREQHTHHSPEK